MVVDLYELVLVLSLILAGATRRRKKGSEQEVGYVVGFCSEGK